MDTYLLRVHQHQVLHQCHAALFAAHQAQNGLNENNQELFWSGIQGLLTASANIAKALWGQSGKLAIERKPLRDSLGIKDNSPIANTDLRNHLDHYDEHLDRWFKTSARRNIVDYMIGPAKSSISDIESTDIFRHFDPSTGHVIFWGEHFSMYDLVKEIEELIPAVKAETDKPHWD